MSTEVDSIVVVGGRRIPLSSFDANEWLGGGSDPDDTSSTGEYTQQPAQSPCQSTAAVNGPLPGDISLIRRAAQELRAAFELQGSYNRHEWAGIIFLMPNGGYYASPPVTSNLPGQVVFNAAALLPSGGQIVAWVHTHPSDGTWQGSPSDVDWTSRDLMANSTAASDDLVTYVVDLAGTDKMREYLANASRSSTARGPVITC